MKDFFETWKFKILIGIAVFLVGIMAYAGANDRLTAAPQELLSVAVATFQKAAAMVGDRVASLWENYTNIGAILDENEQLTAENAELRKQMVDYDRLKAENEAYKALANIQNTRPEMSCVSAFVIGRDPLDAFYGFTLDQGSVDGVELNDTVVSDEGYLLGMVVEVEATSCKVMTILHPNFNAAGVVSRTRDNGIITGSSDYAADGLCVLTNLNRNTLTRKWCRRSAANRPSRSSSRVQTRARCATHSSLPISEEALPWNHAASASAARSPNGSAMRC